MSGYEIGRAWGNKTCLHALKSTAMVETRTTAGMASINALAKIFLIKPADKRSCLQFPPKSIQVNELHGFLVAHYKFHVIRL